MSMISRLEQSIRMWKEKVPTYKDPHFAETPTGEHAVRVDPAKVDPLIFGHHLSAVFAVGRRTWVFEGQHNRDRFVRQYARHGTRPCGNPHS